MIVKNLSFSYDEKQVLDDISFSIQEGKVTTIMGANGCGKTTLFHLMTKNLKPDNGSIYLENRNIERMKLKEFARKVSIVHQTITTWSDMTVEELISYGRIPYRKMGQGQTKEDEKLIAWAMEVTGVADYKQQHIGTLSGGQRQRTWIAMALAQNTKLLFLDEPTTYLDIRYQIEILQLIRKLNREYHITIIMVLHDMNQAIAYSDEIIGLKDGRIAVSGAPQEVLTEDSIEQLYGIKLEVASVNGKMVVLAV